MEPLLGKSTFLDGDAFGVCDIAVGAYLLYLPLFYPDMFIAGVGSTQVECGLHTVWSERGGAGLPLFYRNVFVGGGKVVGVSGAPHRCV
jgi:glutathione S-transferase